MTKYLSENPLSNLSGLADLTGFWIDSKNLPENSAEAAPSEAPHGGRPPNCQAVGVRPSILRIDTDATGVSI